MASNFNEQTFSTPLPPFQHGLYDPKFEKDSCGVGFIANIKGVKSHDIIKDGLQILLNLQHRGACGCDQETGDGAGILIQLPHKFFSEACSQLGLTLPESGSYGVAFAFLPKDATERTACEKAIEKLCKETGLKFLGWRDVPVDSNSVGWLARSQEPYMKQAFIGKSAKSMTQDALETKLYIFRRKVENWSYSNAQPGMPAPIYFASCSSNTIVYKGMLKPDQVDR